eukprot:TRINITY_DN33260_c0_g1_i1.p1 TRINITY_DN33260_c0_g1~~TRINITY_DN33260_c0_g1_i1.p1  ORF type:complete len:691 (+),score=190.00 TRINITY_DN33260_c0_g1_i1:284-2074(+)
MAGDGDDSDDAEFVTPSAAGYLWKRGSATGGHSSCNWRRRFFVLRNDKLLYYQKKPTADNESSLFRGSINLRKCKLGECPPNTEVYGRKNVVKLFQVNDKHYLLSAETPSDLEAWIKASGLPRAEMEAPSSTPTTPGPAAAALAKSAEEAPKKEVAGPDSRPTMHGWMFKRGAATGTHSRANWKRRYFQLKPDCVQYFSKKPESLKDEKKFLKGTIPGVSVKLGETEDEVNVFGKVNCFKLFSNSGKHFILSCDDAFSKEQWLRSIAHQFAIPREAKEINQNAGPVEDTLQGWLYQHNKSSKPWAKRWCVVRGKTFLIFSDVPPSRSKEAGLLKTTIMLKTVQLGEAPPTAVVDGRQCLFKLVSRSNVHFVFSSNTQEELEAWKESLGLQRADQQKITQVAAQIEAAHQKATTVLHSGWLWKRGSVTSTHSSLNWKRRFFILRPGSLFYFTKPPKEGEEQKLCKGIINLETNTTRLGELPDEDIVADRAHCFKVFLENGKHYIISTTTTADKEEWLSKMGLPRTPAERIAEYRIERSRELRKLQSNDPTAQAPATIEPPCLIAGVVEVAVKSSPNAAQDREDSDDEDSDATDSETE